VVNFFPPKPVYPKNYDDDNTLFLVYNTAETVTTEYNPLWADEISIKPVDNDMPEVWADNGFASIEGELFYYDSVEKTSHTGQGFEAEVEVDSLGTITSIIVLNGGSGYSAYPSVNVKGGDWAKISAKVVDGEIISINVIDGGVGYSSGVGVFVFYGKVTKFKRCARSLGGNKTRNNPIGSEVRGFVIAEHHNQIVGAVLNIENFIGINNDTRQETLDWRIRHLQSLPTVFDDFTCPDISFDFYIVSENATTGIVAQYNIIVAGAFTNYRLDFGDGSYTTTSTTGTHTYSTSSTIDPVVTIGNTKCTIVQSPITRTVPTEPTNPITPTTFEIPIPQIPRIPNFNIPTIPVPPTPLIPPIVFPCLDIGPIGPINIPSIIPVVPGIPSEIFFGPLGGIPSLIAFSPIPPLPSFITFGPVPNIYVDVQVCLPTIINFGPVNVPTLVNFGPLNIPTLINFGPLHIPTLISITTPVIPTLISITAPNINIPTLISITTPSIPTLISIIVPEIGIPNEIVFVNTPGPMPAQITFANTPNFGPIRFGPAPTFSNINISGNVTYSGPSEINGTVTFSGAPTFSTIEFGQAPTINVTWSAPPTVSCTVTISCPSGGSGMRNNRSVFDPEDLSPDAVEINMGEFSIPSEIIVKFPEIPDIRVIHDLPAMIRVSAPDIPDIKILSPDVPIPTEIRLVSDLPSVIELKADNLPRYIEIDATNLPKSIPIEVPESFPSIKIDATGIPSQIQVVGIPSVIELVGAPSEIKLVLPEKPEIELVYKGSPIDVKINLDIGRITGDDGNAQCVAIVPCTR